jgi:hypothetical protein
MQTTERVFEGEIVESAKRYRRNFLARRASRGRRRKKIARNHLSTKTPNALQFASVDANMRAGELEGKTLRKDEKVAREGKGIRVYARFSIETKSAKCAISTLFGCLDWNAEYCSPEFTLQVLHKAHSQESVT